MNRNRTELLIGAYLPALNFVKKRVDANVIPQETQTVRRFVSGELVMGGVEFWEEQE